MAGVKPYKANGTIEDPREQKMWDIYVSKLANNIDNAYESAIEAGYEETTAKNITLTGWYKERKDKLRRKDMLSKAERNLNKVLDTKYENDEGKILSDVMRIVVDVSKTVVTTLGKDSYSTREELTGKDGEDLKIEVVNYADNNNPAQLPTEELSA